MTKVQKRNLWFTPQYNLDCVSYCSLATVYQAVALDNPPPKKPEEGSGKVTMVLQNSHDICNNNCVISLQLRN